MTPGVFIVGTGRCGSTLLSQAIVTHPRLLSLSEYFTVLGGARALRGDPVGGDAFVRQFSTPNADLLALTRHASAIPELIGSVGHDRSPLLAVPLPHLTTEPDRLLRELGDYAGRLPVGEIAEQHARVFAWLLQHSSKQVWVERSGGSVEYVEDLVRGWPQAKFIHIARRGADCARSMERHPFFRVKLARILARNPSLPVDVCLAQTLPLDRFGALWSADMMRADRILRRVGPDRLLSFCYEQLLEAPAATLRALAQFIDPDGEHTAWAERAAHLVRAPSGAQPGSIALETACNAGMRVYERIREHSCARPIGQRTRPTEDIEPWSIQ